MNIDVNYKETYLYKFRTFSSLLERILDNTLRKQMGITLPQLMLLMTVSQFRGTNQRQVARHLGISPAAIKRQTDIVKQKGYVTVVEHVGRGEALFVTTTGNKILKTSMEALDKHAFDVFNHHNKSTGLMQHLDHLLEEAQDIVNQENASDNLKKTLSKESNVRHHNKNA